MSTCTFLIHICTKHFYKLFQSLFLNKHCKLLNNINSVWCTSYTVKRNECLNKLSFTVCSCRCCIWCRFRRPPWFRWRWRSHLKPIKTLSYHYHPLPSDIAMTWLWDEAPRQVFHITIFHIVCKNPWRTSKLNLMQWLRKASSAIELRKHQYISLQPFSLWSHPVILV